VRISSPTGCKDVSGLPEDFCYWAIHDPSALAAAGAAPELTADGSMGFEIEVTRPEGDSQAAFYWSWGRLGYDPKAPAAPPARR
jgi:hypothetical protein